jgi:hypothetical protein
MANDLDVTTAPWSISNVEPVHNETANAAYATQRARNTGYLYYAPRLVCPQLELCGTTTGTESSGAASKDVKAYMLAGTYTAYAAFSLGSASPTVTGSSSLDGTLIARGTQQGWASGSATVIISTTGWITGNYYVHCPSSTTGTVKAGAIYVRQTN